ncbi:Gfo/Idh/MocA family protein [Flavihumibacter sp. UBA7668]|uniref:Gfo/Idh/MocA family protein n=1 Tax=Flavihumibacter sp. UBA7668 TaxID=1946542 RepID=UPI0025C14CF8|nr:Gfo/Idh/MocA family oxidoreductase [Flavihumibacter sp. UBA7668]
MIKTLINRYRAIKRAGFLNQSSETKYRYAIIGAGEHATTQLYPCIWHMGIPITAICTKSILNAERAASRFTNCRGTDKLDDIIKDSSIRGVFVSTPPASQSAIVKQLLAVNKSVYVEKPLGYSETELNGILPASTDLVLRLGFQRRFAPIGQLTKKLINQPLSYQYCFRTGAYPEGNVLYEVFIHPLDYCLFLFGPAKLDFVSKIKNTNGETIFLHLDHSGVKGSLELSSQYSWTSSQETLEINQPDSIIQSNYPSTLEKSKKPAQLFGVPLEKVIKQPQERYTYMTANSSIPSIQNHSSNLLGFYPAIQSFFHATEQNLNSEIEIRQLKMLYKLLDQLHNA